MERWTLDIKSAGDFTQFPVGSYIDYAGQGWRVVRVGTTSMLLRRHFLVSTEDGTSQRTFQGQVEREVHFEVVP